MKQLTAFGICLCLFGSAYAQQTTTVKKTTTTTQKTANGTQKTTTTTTRTVSKANRNVISGSIHDIRNHPMAGLQTFVYAPDSSIIASGYTDAMGMYETNSVMPGTYKVKIVYPSNKAVIITDVTLKRGSIMLNLKADPPSADTVITYGVLVPKPAEKPRGKKAAAH